jgi:two-component system chemotaxis response regulator CheB
MSDPKTRVLVIDDSALVRTMLGEIINRQRDMCCVGAAADPLVAREMIRELNPDVITLDVVMPRMDGFETAARLRAREATRHIPVVMVSAAAQEGDLQRGREIGVDAYITKPFQPEELVRVVRDLTTAVREQD